MAYRDRAKGPDRRVTALLDRLAFLLKGLKADRADAFEEHLHGTEKRDEAQPGRVDPPRRD